MTERILIVLPNWFGETLFVTPFLRALRQQKTGAFIAVLGWTQTHEVLLGNPNIDLLLSLDEAGKHRGLAGWWRLMGELREHHFGCAYILRKSLTRTLLAACAGIPERIGFANSKSGWLLTREVPTSGVSVHKAKTYLRLLAASGTSGTADRFDYFVSKEEHLNSEELLKANQLRPGFVLLHIGANWAHKRWPLEKFAALADLLIEKQRVQIAVSGSPSEAQDAQQVQRSMRNPAALLAGKTTVRELAACCLEAGVVVANDTGVLHIAAALGKPVVALFAPTSPAITGPLGDASKISVIFHTDGCPVIPCYQPENPPHLGMARIEVEEVYAAACELLGRVL